METYQQRVHLIKLRCHQIAEVTPIRCPTLLPTKIRRRNPRLQQSAKGFPQQFSSVRRRSRPLILATPASAALKEKPAGPFRSCRSFMIPACRAILHAVNLSSSTPQSDSRWFGYHCGGLPCMGYEEVSRVEGAGAYTSTLCRRPQPHHRDRGPPIPTSAVYRISEPKANM